jgi:hypothetical protein
MRAHAPSRPRNIVVDTRAPRRRGPGPHLQIRLANTMAAQSRPPGPNALCDSRPILPLTEHKSAVEAVLAQMHAKGSTNILDLMWGWRVLSPEEPFMQGRPYGDPENNYLILMTAGETIHQAAANHNKSISHAFGWASNGRLGATATSRALIGQMNNKTRAACENAKAAGITVDTIASGSKTMPTRAPCWRAAPRVRRKAYAASNGADPDAGLRGDCVRNREIANRPLRPGKAVPFSGGACLCTSNWDLGQRREPPRGAGDGPHPGAAARRRRGRRHRRGEGTFCRCRGREAAARREPPRASAVRKAGQKLSIDWGQALRTPAGARARPANVARLGCVQSCASCSACASSVGFGGSKLEANVRQSAG